MPLFSLCLLSSSQTIVENPHSSVKAPATGTVVYLNPFWSSEKYGATLLGPKRYQEEGGIPLFSLCLLSSSQTIVENLHSSVRAPDTGTVVCFEPSLDQ